MTSDLNDMPASSPSSPTTGKTGCFERSTIARASDTLIFAGSVTT